MSSAMFPNPRDDITPTRFTNMRSHTLGNISNEDCYYPIHFYHGRSVGFQDTLITSPYDEGFEAQQNDIFTNPKIGINVAGEDTFGTVFEEHPFSYFQNFSGPQLQENLSGNHDDDINFLHKYAVEVNGEGNSIGPTHISHPSLDLVATNAYERAYLATTAQENTAKEPYDTVSTTSHVVIDPKLSYVSQKAPAAERLSGNHGPGSNSPSPIKNQEATTKSKPKDRKPRMRGRKGENEGFIPNWEKMSVYSLSSLRSKIGATKMGVFMKSQGVDVDHEFPNPHMIYKGKDMSKVCAMAIKCQELHQALINRKMDVARFSAIFGN